MIHIQPNASSRAYTGEFGEALTIRMVEPLADGAANTDLTRIITEMPARRKQMLLRTMSAGVTRAVLWGCVVLMAAGCAGPAPVLYPNRQFQTAGEDMVKEDIENCRQMAEDAGAIEGSGKGGQVAKSTAVGAGAGAAAGAVGGAISGGAGMGALIGAASGAVWSFIMALFSAGSSSNPAYVNFVNRCLAEKGYEVTGWQ